MTPGEVVIGLIFWAVVFSPMWFPPFRQMRKEMGVSGNDGSKSGPNWEQDSPYPEVFEEDL